MRIAWIPAVVMWAAVAIPARAAEQTTAPSPAQSPDEQAIRRVIEAFATAYNAGDAATLAALFTPTAEIVDSDGHRSEGRAAIEKVFAGIFQAHPKSRIQFAVDSIRFVSPTVAMEDGVAVVTDAEGQFLERTRYTTVHMKDEGEWRMASARDLAEGPSADGEPLKQLEWLIGDWVDESPDSLVVTSYRWADNHHFILNEFKVQIKGRPAMTGSQRIGWDPLTKQIRSWAFDSEGGFGEGLWTRDANRWIVKATAVTHEGHNVSATNVMTQLGSDRMKWQSRDRTLGGQSLPDVGPIHIARKPPEPR
jgi:uncharacterized protein (TIGR02246 family)